jgi:DNA polymerase-3 subunit delta
MIYLIYGEDEYRLSERLKSLLKNGDEINTTTFESWADFAMIKNEADTLPFLSEKKIMVLKDILSSKNKELISKIEEWLPLVGETTDLIFVEKKVDQRLNVIKNIQKHGKVEAFENLKPFELAGWIEKTVKESGGQISRSTAEKLGMMIGNDLIRLENEIKKLITYNPQISDENIDLLVKSEFSQSIFGLMDAVSEKNAKKSLKLLDEFLGNEENEIYLLSMFARQVRNLMIVKDLSIKGKSESEIAKITGFHPFVIKKTLAQTKNFKQDKLIRMHEQLLKADIELKNNNIEPKVILSRLILTFVS